MSSAQSGWYRVVYPDERTGNETIRLAETLGPDWTQDLYAVGGAVRAARALGLRVRVEYMERRWETLSDAEVAEALPYWCRDDALTADTAAVGTWVAFYEDEGRRGRVETPPDAEGRVGIRWRARPGDGGGWCCDTAHSVALRRLRALTPEDVPHVMEQEEETSHGNA